MFKLLLGGPNEAYPLGGGPPGAPGASPGVPECQRVLEKIAKILKYYVRIAHASKYPKL